MSGAIIFWGEGEAIGSEEVDLPFAKKYIVPPRKMVTYAGKPVSLLDLIP